MTEEKPSRGMKFLEFVVPSFSVGLGTYMGVGGLAEIVSDIVAKNPIETPDKMYTAIGAGLVMYGIGLLEKAKSDYRE